MRPTLLATACGLVFFASYSSLAGADEILGEIVVTAPRYRVPFVDAQPGISVIARPDIEASPARTLPELLARQAGINLRDLHGTHSGTSTVDLRGFGAAAGQNALVMIDGRPLNDWDLSGVVWSALPLEQVERIEVLRGSQSVLYGAGASGGVINIVTRETARQAAPIQARMDLGSFGERKVQATTSLGGEATRLSLSAGIEHADGYRDNNEHTQHNLFGDLLHVTEHGEVGLKLSADRQTLRMPGARQVQPSAGVDQLTTDRRGTGTPLDWAKRAGWSAGGYGRWAIGSGELLLDLAYRRKDQDSYYDFGGFPDYREAELGLWTLSPRYRLKMGPNENHTLLLGMDLLRWDYDLAVSNAPSNVGQPINRVDASQEQIAVYLRDSVKVGRTVKVNLGARLERMAVSANDVYDPTAPGAFFGSAAPAGSQSAWQRAWEAGLSWSFSPVDTLYGRAGRSYRFATVDELYEFTPIFTRAFQFLRPQSSRDLEVGVQRQTPSGRLRAALYQMRVKDEIHLDPYGAGIGNTNLPPLRRYGAELEGSHRLGKLALSGAYTLTQAEFTAGSLNGLPLDGREVPLVPRHHLTLGLGWAFAPQTDLGLDLRYVGSQYMDNDETNTFFRKIPAYALTDLKLRHNAGHWRWSLGILNLLDRDYYSYAVRSTNPMTPDRFNAYPLPGRSILATLEYRPGQEKR